jgi:hypothetical protein
MNAKELSRHPVITMTEGSGLTQAFDTWAAGQGLHMQRIVASNSLMAIVGLTMAADLQTLRGYTGSGHKN